jgi:hypothetical protein
MRTILAILALTVLCNAGQYRVTWDAHPDATVREFRVYRITGAVRELLATSPVSAAVIETGPGTVIAVTAFNGAESALSDPVTIPAAIQPPQPPTGLRVVEIQTSSNLTDWDTIAYVPLHDDSPQRFVRAHLTTIPQP